MEHRAEWVFLACDVTWNLAFYSSLRKLDEIKILKA